MENRKFTKIVQLTLSGLCAAVLLTGCGQGAAVSGSSEAEQEAVIPVEQELVHDYTSPAGLQVEPGAYVAVVVKGLGENNYWKIIRQGVEAAVSDVNEAMGFTDSSEIRLTFEGPSEEGNEEEQINTLDTVLAENPAVLCLAAADMESCQAQLETARDNEIPVLILDAGVESSLVTAVCQTDNEAAGREAGKRLCEKLNGTGRVALVCHEPKAETAALRSQGFRSALEEYPGIELVCIVEPDDEYSLEEKMAAMQEEYPDLDGIFSTNESSSDLVLQLYEQEEEIPVLVGFDNGTEQIRAIRDGVEYGCISQNPYTMGYAVVIAALRAAAGEEIDSFIDTGYIWIDQSNIDDPDTQMYLYD
ncbi:MAG: substrate-binding domain-containing protein [Lachnospiraceae bacterium]|nr:substrate-binding domain-containing protein [Lachnospiraceae bacterium]